MIYLKELVDSAEDWQNYEQLLASMSDFVVDFVKFMAEVSRTAEEAAGKDNRLHHSTVFQLARHIMESVDGIAVLASKGCAQPCAPLLRSAFEGFIGLIYILKAERENRGLAYQVAHVHRRIKLYRKCDPTDVAGKELRAKLAHDPMVSVLDNVKVNLPAAIANLEAMLKRPEYVPIEEAWKKARKKSNRGDPPWFSLFDGPRNIAGLASHVDYAAIYEFLYRQWSDVVHAGSGFDHVGASLQGEPVHRPLRHPESLQTAIRIAVSFCLAAINRLIDVYIPERRREFMTNYEANLRDRFVQIASGRSLISAPWKMT